MEHPLKTWRLAKGLTLDDVAKRIGTSASTVSRIEARRHRRFRSSMLVAIEKATGGEVSPHTMIAEALAEPASSPGEAVR